MQEKQVEKKERVINKIYWIRELAGPLSKSKPKQTDALGWKSSGRSSKHVKGIVEEAIKPMIVDAAREPESLVVLVKTPFSPNLKKTKDIERAIEYEASVERLLKRFVKDRAIILSARQDTIATVKEMIKEKGFAISEHTKLIGYGSFLKDSPENYIKRIKHRLAVRGRFEIPGEGSISNIKQRRRRITRRRTR